MSALCEVALRPVMLGTASCGDYPSIIEFIVFARPASARPASARPASAGRAVSRPVPG